MTDIEKTIASFGREFRRVGSVTRAEGEKKYLKSDLKFFGASKPAVRQVVKTFHAAHTDIQKTKLIALVRALWRTDYHELRSVGIGLLERYVRILGVNDLVVVEELLRKSETWAYVDWLSVNVAGDLVIRYKSARSVLPRWARDDYMWVRRASMLALLPSLKKSGDDFALFDTFATSMIEEKEFFIRKAIGWILREVGKKRPDEAFRYLKRNIDDVAGLTLREGSKYLPPDMRETLMARYAAR